MHFSSFDGSRPHKGSMHSSDRVRLSGKRAAGALREDKKNH
jgi:hypothetical protein